MQENSGKCYLILSTSGPAKIQAGKSLIESSDYEKLLGVKLILNFHLRNISKQFVKKQVMIMIARVP